MAQIQSGEFKLHPELTNLFSLCEDALDGTRALLQDKDIELVRIYPDFWPQLYVDPMRIKQALYNLLGNAAKYTEEGFVMLRVWSDETHHYLQVADSGIGIDPEHHARIFREFQQVDETAARRRVGTGLGLPITRHLVERHAGTISVDSAAGEGSRFTIALPLPVEPPAEPVPANPAAAQSVIPAANGHNRALGLQEQPPTLTLSATTPVTLPVAGVGRNGTAAREPAGG
jgi:signal transduction histidine kinase